MDNMPCANTSFMPAFLAKSMSMWIGLWSPEAPANRASVVRLIGASCNTGRASPTWIFCASNVMASPLGVAHDDDRVQIGDMFAKLVRDLRVVDDELQRTALLVVDVAHPGLKAQGVARTHRRVVDRKSVG